MDQCNDNYPLSTVLALHELFVCLCDLIELTPAIYEESPECETILSEEPHSIFWWLRVWALVSVLWCEVTMETPDPPGHGTHWGHTLTSQPPPYVIFCDDLLSDA